MRGKSDEHSRNWCTDGTRLKKSVTGTLLKSDASRCALTLASLITSGCAALGVTLFGVGAGVSGSTGVSYTLDSIAYKTFPTSVETLQNATLRALQRMDIELKDIEVQEDQAYKSPST